MIEGHEERGEAIPEHLIQPDLLPGADEILAAFWEISTDRQMGMGAGPIPASAIERWADRHGIADPDDLASFRGAIRAMDRVFLTHFNNDSDGTGTSAPQKQVESRPMSPALFEALFAGR